MPAPKPCAANLDCVGIKVGESHFGFETGSEKRTPPSWKGRPLGNESGAAHATPFTHRESSDGYLRLMYS